MPGALGVRRTSDTDRVGGTTNTRCLLACSVGRRRIPDATGFSYDFGHIDQRLPMHLNNKPDRNKYWGTGIRTDMDL